MLLHWLGASESEPWTRLSGHWRRRGDFEDGQGLRERKSCQH